MSGLRAICLGLTLAGAVLLAACETPGGTLITYAAQGTLIQAERLVAIVYGKPGKPLAYGGGDIERPLQRMRARWPALRGELQDGRLGLTEFGTVALREPGPHPAALVEQVRDENRDRQMLYRAISEAVGHGGEMLVPWLPYTEESFGKEWIRQAEPGWWYLDRQQVWQRKEP